MSYIPEIVEPIPIDLEGAKSSVSSRDEAILQVNQDIVTELKKLNFQLMLVTDVHLDNGDFYDESD